MSARSGDRERGVLVLMGGPDAEREVSLASGASIAQALRAAGRWDVHERTIERPTLAELREMPGEVVFPALHGRFGEGGVLQELLERDGRPYVGCGPRAARLGMDKIGTLLLASGLGIPTLPGVVLDSRDEHMPHEVPFVVKPVHDGSSVGLHICREAGQWPGILALVREDQRRMPGRAYMAEPFVDGWELTVGIVLGAALPAIRIMPAEGVYDYQAKYVRDDTVYQVGPHLPGGVAEAIALRALRLASAMGVRDIARVDFMLGQSTSGGRWSDEAWLLEINTMPGFTSHSLVPKAARHAGRDMPALVSALVEAALTRGSGARREPSSASA